MYRNTRLRYGAVAQLLHWSIVILIAIQFILASIFEDLPLSMEKINTIAQHKSVGISILFLAIIRLVWKLSNLQPDLPDNLKPYERKLAGITHWSLYFIIFAMPVSGWIMSSLAGIPVNYFGLFALPDFIGPDKGLVPILKGFHEFLALSLIIIVVLHIAAAIKHHFYLKDDVLLRMLPKFSKRP